MGRFKALICGASNLRRYQKIENNEENTTTKDYYCYKCAECGHRGKAKVRTFFLIRKIIVVFYRMFSIVVVV